MRYAADVRLLLHHQVHSHGYLTMQVNSHGNSRVANSGSPYKRVIVHGDTELNTSIAPIAHLQTAAPGAFG